LPLGGLRLVYYQNKDPAEKPPGCLDVLAITRAIFAILLWPMIAVVVVLVDVAATVVLYTKHPALALVTIVPTVIAIWLFARWEQRRFRPPDL
jgi:hypothetical protein